MARRSIGFLCITLFALFDAMVYNTIHHMGPAVHAMQIICIGNAVAAIGLLIIARIQRQKLATKQLKLHITRAVLEVFGAGMLFYSLSYIPAAQGKAIMFLSPVLATVMAVLVLKEQSRLYKWAALIISFAAVIYIIQPNDALFQVQSLYTLAGAVFLSLALTLVRVLSANEQPLLVALYFTVITALLSFFPMLYFWQPLNGELIGWLVLLGLLFLGIQYSISCALSILPLVDVTPFFFLSLVFTAAIAYGWIDAVPNAATLIGGAIIIATATYTAHREMREHARHRPPAA